MDSFRESNAVLVNSSSRVKKIRLKTRGRFATLSTGFLPGISSSPVVGLYAPRDHSSKVSSCPLASTYQPRASSRESSAANLFPVRLSTCTATWMWPPSWGTLGVTRVTSRVTTSPPSTESIATTMEENVGRKSYAVCKLRYLSSKTVN